MYRPSLPAALIALSLAGALALVGCNKPAAPAPAALSVGSPTKLAIGQKARCAVTGEEFVVSASTVQVEHAGKHYGFCCEDCKPTFDKNPAKYAK